MNTGKLLFVISTILIILVCLILLNSLSEKSNTIVLEKEEANATELIPIISLVSSSNQTILQWDITNQTELEWALIVIGNAVEGQNWTMGQYVGGVRYNCADFTKDALLALRSNGYNETTAYALCNGDLKEGNWHYWIGITLQNGTMIEIEPQNGQIITDHSGIYSPWGRRCVVRGIW